MLIRCWRGPALLVIAVAACSAAPPGAGPVPAGAPPRTDARPEPATPSGRALVQLVDAINSGDSATLARYAGSMYAPRHLAESGGVLRAVQRWTELHAHYGHLEIDSLIPIDDAQARAWLRGRPTRAWIDLWVVVDSVAPHQVTAVRVGRGIRPPFADARRPQPSPAGLPAQMDAFLREMSRAGHFSGAVAVWRGGRPLFERAYGMADRAAGVPNSPRTRFDLASVGKVFTAVAVLQLADEGRVDLDAPVGRYVPGLPPQVGMRVTVRHLLEHSSGLGEIGPGLDSAMAQARTVSEMVRLLTDTTLVSAPGTRFSYSNRGYLLLGAVVEAASGEDYFGYIEKRIFRRAGMEDSGFFPHDQDVERRSVRYTRFPDPRGGFVRGPAVPSAFHMNWRGSPAGGALSTVRDLARFGDALLAGRLVSASALAQMTRGRPEYPWGYGFDVGGYPGSFGHRGATPGSNAHFWVFPQSRTVVVALSNDGRGGNLAGDYLREVIAP